MKASLIRSGFMFALLFAFTTGCGNKAVGVAPEAVTWESLSTVDETLAHAAPVDAPDIALMVSELASPDHIPNAELVQTMLVDLKTLGQELKETTESDVPEHFEAMHVLVGKMLTEAGLDQHVCDHDHDHSHGEEEDAPEILGSEENGPE